MPTPPSRPARTGRSAPGNTPPCAPAGPRPEFAGVRIEAADVDGLFLSRPLDIPGPARPRHADQQFGQITVARRFAAAHVEHLAVARIVGARAQEGVAGVVHVDEVAHLRAVAEDLDFAILDGQPDEPADEALPVVLDQLPRTIHVGQPQRARAHAEHVVVDQVVVLARHLVDAVHIGRPHQLRLVHRQRIGPPVDLPRAREHDLRARVVVPARFEQRQLAAAVDLEVRIRIPHAVDVAHLPGQVEDDRPVAHQVVHRRLLPDVGHVHPHPVGHPVQVVQVPTVLVDQRIHQQDIRPEVDQLARQVASDEAQPARNHHLPAGVERPVVSVHERGRPDAASEPCRGAASGRTGSRRCRRSTTS